MEDEELTEDEEEAIFRQQDRPRSLAPWRRPLVALLWLAAIAFAVWYIGYGPGIPSLSSSRSGAIPNDSTFVSLQSQGIELGASGGPAPEIGKPAPDFTLLDLDGNAVRLSDFRGKTVVLNAWATWCPPCRKEFPELVNLYDANKGRGLVVLGLNLQEPREQVRKFAQEFGATFPIVIDVDADVTGRYRLLGLPTTWFIDSQGILRAQNIGLLTKKIIAEKLSDAGFDVTPGS